MTDNDDRRENTRYNLRAFAEIGNSDQQWAAHVLDVSLQGMRIALLDDYSLFPGDTIRIKVELMPLKNLTDKEQFLFLNGIVAHQKKHILGVFFQPESQQDADLLEQLLLHIKNI